MIAAISLVASAGVVMSGCAAGSNAGGSGGAGQYRFVNATATGTVIPLAKRKPTAAFMGELIDGGSYKLADHRGRIVLINFWATWCAPCVIESPMLETVYRTMKAQGVDFVGIDIKDEREAARSFIKDKRMTYPMIYDEPARTSLQLDIPTRGLPVTALVDRAGRVAAVYLGAVRRNDITPVLRRLAAESP